jgi:DNA-binding transcriptional ArsR family regulator
MRKSENPFAELKNIFHEPNRLAIMAALCNSVDGLTFNQLKEECDLTDGNLSRHLNALSGVRAVRIRKSFVSGKPQTMVFLSDRGRESFIEYLKALEEVLKKAADSVATAKSERRRAPLLGVWKPAR